VVCGGTDVCGSLTSWRVQGAGCFCLWALNLVKVRGGRVCGETFFSCGCSVLFMVTPVYVPSSPHGGLGWRCLCRETLVSRGCSSVPSATCLGGCVLRVASASFLTPLVPRESCVARPWLWVVLFEFIAYLTGLNSNPFGSSDPWVAARPSGFLAGGPGVCSPSSLVWGRCCSLGDHGMAPIRGLGFCLRSRQVSCCDTSQKATCNLSHSDGDSLGGGGPCPSWLEGGLPNLAQGLSSCWVACHRGSFGCGPRGGSALRVLP
ncbi:hypothetical protein Taro_046635, partial [Colocasia esculenta]|nr:hypothetical protein [Colocasia esculenta]